MTLLKKVALLLSVAGTGALVLARYSIEAGVCAELSYRCVTVSDRIEHATYFFPVLLIFFIITHFTTDHVAEKWWRFARLVAPISLFLLILINFDVFDQETGGSLGWGSLGNDILHYYGSLMVYVIFVVGSLFQIARGYFRKV